MCLCDTLYFKVDEGTIKRDSIIKYWWVKNVLIILYIPISISYILTST